MLWLNGSMEKLIRQTLATIDREFRPNELAYLALTTKIENPLRDRWAFLLHKSTEASVTVAREWFRTDIALLEGTVPKALIELKAMYTFDAALDQEKITGFCDAMEKDEEKALSLSNGKSDIFTVLLATHPGSAVTGAQESVIKYHQGINRALKRYGKSEDVASVAVKAVNRRLAKQNVIASGIFDGGCAFEINTQVFYWLVKA